MQKTINREIYLRGHEVLGGRYSGVILIPRGVDHGIVFKGTDPYKTVRLNLGNLFCKGHHLFLEDEGIRVRYVEHISATLYAYGIDNVLVQIENRPSRSYLNLDSLHLASKDVVFPEFEDLQRTVCDKINDVGLRVQEKEKRRLTIKRDFSVGDRLTFERISGEDLVVNVKIDYEGVIKQEKEIVLSPENYYAISTARPFLQHLPSYMPSWIMSIIASFAHPQFGIGHGFRRENLFFGKNSEKEWLAQERVKGEIPAHKVIDLLGVVASLEGKLTGVKITCNRSSHLNDVNTFKKYRNEFVECN